MKHEIQIETTKIKTAFQFKNINFDSQMTPQSVSKESHKMIKIIQHILNVQEYIIYLQSTEQKNNTTIQYHSFIIPNVDILLQTCVCVYIYIQLILILRSTFQKKGKRLVNQFFT